MLACTPAALFITLVWQRMSLAKKRLRVSSSLADHLHAGVEPLEQPGKQVGEPAALFQRLLGVDAPDQQVHRFDGALPRLAVFAVLGVRHQQQLDPLLGEELEHCARDGAGLGALQDFLLRDAFGDLELLPVLDAAWR